MVPQPIKRFSWFVFLLLGAALTAAAQRSPVIYYSDLTGGPVTGGKSNHGAIVSIYGRNFGTSRGTSTVQVAGVSAYSYLQWNDTKIAFQMGTGTQSGDITVNIPGLGASNGIPFAIHAGNIYFVATTGNDGNAGTYDQPFLTLVKARKIMQPGDITYAMNGVTQAADDGRGWKAALTLDHGGLPDAPIALVAYPSATVKIGSSTGPNYGIRKCCGDYWVIAGMQITGGSLSAAEIGSSYRLVANKFYCPKCDGPSGAIHAVAANNVQMYGNEVTQVSTSLSKGSTKLYHAVYFTTDSNHIDIGWNNIHDNKTCRAIQFYSTATGPAGTAGFNQYDLHVHDNMIHGDACDGINFATVDPSKGTVEAYNNIIYSVGRGPDPVDGLADYACIYVPGTTNDGAAGTGTVQIYNNTLYDCGARKSGKTAGAIVRGNSSPGMMVNLTNNIIYLKPGEDYLQGTGTAYVTGSHNLFYGSGNSKPVFADMTSVDPRFTDITKYNFALLPTSPMIDSGLPTPALLDMFAHPRPEGNGFDIGALEYSPY